MMDIITQHAFLPWLKPQWEQLLGTLASGRISPALLIYGQKGLGKTYLARLWAQKLLCKSEKASLPCEVCSGCRLFMAGTHPDFMPVQPVETDKSINIDAIRQLINKLSLRPQYNGYRVVIIEPADQLNINAANALLKTLEEPAPYTLIILITPSIHKLPATVLSRCQKIFIPLPENITIRQWLQSGNRPESIQDYLGMTRTGPLTALTVDAVERYEKIKQMLSGLEGLLNGLYDPALLAGEWEQAFDEDQLEWIMTWVRNLVYLQNNLQDLIPKNDELDIIMEGISSKISLPDLYRYWDLLLSTRQQLGGTLNQRLMLEELLITWCQLAR